MPLPTLFAYLPKEAAEALCKLAEGAATKPHPIKPILAGVLGMGAGTLAGAGGAHIANEVYRRYNQGKNIPVPYLMAAAPILGGGLGLAYNLAQAHQIEELQRAAQSPDDKSKRRVPRE